MDQIRQAFEKSVPLTDAEWAIFSERVQRHSFAKKTVILKKGQVENTLSFVEKGITRLYVPGNENDLTFAFVFGGNFLSAYDSFISRQPAQYEVETLSDTVMWSITHAHLQEVYRLTPVGNQIGRLAAEDQFIKKAKRELSLLRDSPEKRYLNLFTEQPQLIREIPLKYIASYIGITPQALSRIRKRII